MEAESLWEHEGTGEGVVKTQPPRNSGEPTLLDPSQAGLFLVKNVVCCKVAIFDLP